MLTTICHLGSTLSGEKKTSSQEKIPLYFIFFCSAIFLSASSSSWSSPFFLVPHSPQNPVIALATQVLVCAEASALKSHGLLEVKGWSPLRGVIYIAG